METSKKIDVLEKLVQTFQQENACEIISGELSNLRQHCVKIINEERLRRINSTGDIMLRTCSFSKLQFPESQIERSGPNVPVRGPPLNIAFINLAIFTIVG
ncbi:uncharacterized protein LOC124448268 [Xenia sp. Carnegie-2017]|uniref:uncharacterized protein LOC124446438 n=1 Tax=Xenia sp. Carnegie-2017 TaxID=2897299 RepID=UPI001F035016|nr:uncharacterized protein LOC124446438 [Xenia sp. Carnegie-2017]XP_046855232.1 uncharacterized protein LOC124448268 [Xenia sp. Carnegie-2017]